MNTSRKIELIEEGVRHILTSVNPFWDCDENLMETPERVAKAYTNTWLSGYEVDALELMTTFTHSLEGHRDLVMVKDIQFYSLCAHHLCPFMGKAAIGYIPDDKVVGLSKLARILEVYSRRLQLQEAITSEVANVLVEGLKPQGVMVVLYNVEHTCMSSRGVKAHEARTTTSAVRGVFETDSSLRSEFLSLLNL